MGKKSRKKRKNKRWVKVTPDEVIQYGPLRIARYGKHIRLHNESTPEEHAAFLKHSEEAHKKIIDDLTRDVVKLQNYIKEYDPVELMHQAAYMILPLLMKYRSENEFGFDESYYLPAVEYIQYLIARTPPNTSKRKPTESEWAEIWKETLDIIKLTQMYIFTRKTLTTPPSEIDELRFILDVRRLAIRGRRYHFFLADHFKVSLIPYEPWIKEIYNVEINDLIKGLQEIDDYQKTGVLDRYIDLMNTQKVFMQKLVEKGYAVDPGASPEEIERTKQALASEEFKSLFEEINEKVRLTFTSAIFEITNLTSLPKQILSLLSVRPGESILTTLTGPDHDDLSPLSPSVLRYKPFLEFDDKYYTFYHSGFEDHITEIIESDLFVKRPGQISDMAKRRSDYMELTSKDLLASLICPDFVFQNLYYPNPDQPGNLTELDIMFGVDDILFLVEVKSGGFSEGAIRGAPKEIESELSDLIIKGQQQSERAEKYIKSNEEVDFFDQSGRNVLHKIKHSNFRKIFRIIVTREELGWVGSKIAVLSILDPNLSKSFPWHVSIDDLRVIAELFKDNELRFVHFLEQRLRASAELALNQHDEIEHVGLYNKINYYHELPTKDADRISFDASYMRDIDYYFSERSAGGSPEIPSQPMPPRMREFINALRDSHLAGRFEVASLILSMDETGRNQIQEALDTLYNERAKGKQKTVRMPLTASSIGLSIANVDGAYWQNELITSAAQMIQSICGRWLVVQLSNDSQGVINRIERIFPGKFTELELAPGKAHIEKIVQRTIASQKNGRNDKCPCGSGKKYKKCHGR